MFTLYEVVLMVETIEEFMDEVKEIRQEMQQKGRTADRLLLASWLDRLLISLERVSPTIALMAIELEELSMAEPIERTMAAKTHKSPKKKAKKSKSRRR